MTDDELAAQALEAWRTGAASGDWSGLIALLVDDVRISMPFKERWRGEKRGIAEARELLRHAAEDLKVRLDQALVEPMLRSGRVFAVEMVGVGTVGGEPARVPVSLWFEIADGRIAAIREYLGDPA